MTRTNSRLAFPVSPRKRPACPDPAAAADAPLPIPPLCCLACLHARHHPGPQFAASLPGSPVREICNQMPNPSISAPPPRSYRLRRHFPRHCDVTTRVLHPYKPRFFRERERPAACAVASLRDLSASAQETLLPGPLPRACALRIRTLVPGCLPPVRPDARLRSAPPGKTDFRIPGFPVSENITSLLSSRRESAPSKPSRGTGYG